MVAAGNTGTTGTFATADPAVVAAILSVGSVGNEIIPTTYNVHHGERRKIGYFQVLPLDRKDAVSVFGSGIEDNDPTLNPANGCDDRAWDIAFESIDDQEHPIIIPEQDDTCFPYNINQKLQWFNGTRLLYYPTTPEHIPWVD